MGVEMLGRAIVVARNRDGASRVGIPFAAGQRYVDDGTAAAFLIVLLALTSWMPAEVGRDRWRGGRLGRVRLLPLHSGVLRVRQLRPDGGRRVARLCTLLSRSGRSSPPRGGADNRIERGPGLLAGTPASPSWSSGLARRRKRRAVVLEPLLVRPRRRSTASRSRRGLRSADRGGGAHDAAGRLSRRARRRVTFGYSEVAFVSAAFGDFGSMGAGAWIEAAGGVLLLGGIVVPQVVGSSGPAPRPPPG